MRKMRRKSALIFAALLLMLAAAPGNVYGSLGIETEKADCSIAFDLGNLTGEGSDFAGLTALEIPVDLYKVADVKMDGSYVPGSSYSGLAEDLKAALDAANVQDQERKAEEWLNLAEGFRELIPENTFGEYQTTLTEGAGQIDDLPVGLYLVCARKVWSEEFIYTFSPYLISVPDNGYYKDDTREDAWIYHVEVSLKPERENRFGDLEIVKTLDSYNESLGSATFIFQIDAHKDEFTYSDVVSLVLDGPGTRSVILRQKLPAGASVTVREVYSGPSYSAGSGEIQNIESALAATILSDKLEVNMEEKPKNQVSFTNHYDNRLNGGTSVVNHFTYMEGTQGGPWVWTQQGDSSEGE